MYQQSSILALTLTFALLTDRTIAEIIGREFPAFAGGRTRGLAVDSHLPHLKTRRMTN
jgi:hypothetical protein